MNPGEPPATVAIDLGTGPRVQAEADIMTILIWASIGLVVGFLIGRGRDLGPEGALIGLLGAIVGGLVGNQLWGPDPIEFTWDLVATGRAVLGVLFATELDVAGAVIGAGVASLLLVTAAKRGRTTVSA